MELVLNLLAEKKDLSEKKLAWLQNDVTEHKNAITELKSQDFIESNKDANCWSSDWTIEDFIRVNIESRERSIESCLKEIEEQSKLVSQLNKAISILKEE